ncbi:MAG: Rad52/Rad22 family DNA repair protein [Bdellovibrionia bacterium]
MKAKAEMKTQKSQPEAATSAPTLVHSANSESSSILNQEDLKILKAPFPKESLGVKVQSTSKDRTRALLVLYLQHTDVQDRLEMVDPAWTTEVINEERVGDTVYVRIRMTVKGVSRENVGEGNDPKAAYSDALKRAAMLFGIGRYLYDSPTVWADYNESRDKFRQWSIQDYEKFVKGSYVTPSPAPVAAQPPAEPRETSRPEPRSESPGLTTKAPASSKEEKGSKGKSSARSREQLNRVLMNLYRPYLTKFPETRFVELLQNRYNVGETRLMTLEQIEDLVSYMEQQLSSAA